MLNADSRRKEILKLIKGSKVPVSGSYLANQFHVSRQIIVQDIAILKAEDNDIIATTKGYMLNEKNLFTRVVKVHHTDEEIEDELNAIVDLGGTVLDVFVWHKVYGKIEGTLNINSRLQVAEFMYGIKSGKSSPLKNVTAGYHYHTIQAETEETLDLIEHMLESKGYSVEEHD